MLPAEYGIDPTGIGGVLGLTEMGRQSAPRPELASVLGSVVGDPLTLVAGILKTPLRVFLPLVIVARLGRYRVIAGAVTLLSGI